MMFDFFDHLWTFPNVISYAGNLEVIRGQDKVLKITLRMGGREGLKRLKMCLRNIWMVPNVISYAGMRHLSSTWRWFSQEETKYSKSSTARNISWEHTSPSQMVIKLIHLHTKHDRITQFCFFGYTNRKIWHESQAMFQLQRHQQHCSTGGR